MSPDHHMTEDSAGTPSEAARGHAADLAAFVRLSPSSFHAAHEAGRRLTSAGFRRLAEADDWAGTGDTGAGKFFVIRDGALVAWVVPDGAGPTTGFSILGAHTDSPTFKLKPKPSAGAFGWLQAGVEIYGGPLLNSWLDRELHLAGRVVTHDGAEHLVRTRPILRFPQLAIHLDRNVNEGLALNKQTHMNPIWGLGVAHESDLLALVADEAGVAADEIGGYDLVVADSQQAEIFGGSQEFLASGRLDNLSSVHAGLSAIIGTGPEQRATISVLAAFDHEEIGSSSRSGACGPLLEDLLTRISLGLGADESQRLQAYARSFCVSADAGHSIHPNYPERHDPANRPIAGGGPLLKINANQRYATDAVGSARWARICTEAGVPYQEFVSNNVMPCGSTIGPLTATRLGIRTVDVGIALLSMHSARELCAVADPHHLARAIGHFFRTAS